MTIKKILIVATLSSVASFANASVVDTFDAGAEGWSGTGGFPLFSYSATGGVGNSGYIQLIDMAGGQMAATSPAFGDQSSTYGGLLSFSYDVTALLSHNVYSANNAFGTVTIASGGLFVTADLIAPISSNITGSGWHFASLGLDNGLWSGNALLATVLSDVTGVSIVTEYNQSRAYPDEVVGLDNFILAARTTSGVPEPETIALLAIGVLGSFVASRRRHQ